MRSGLLIPLQALVELKTRLLNNYSTLDYESSC